ncbi:MAG: 5-bromo-4-chloroindolyl phosphate hydrolysis family protein [Lachnospiraceae bacterium]|nr:5-bromo-4-chloroindolyl phosphate hydrolysis family protein [Lachnospiraceae bacterium]
MNEKKDFSDIGEKIRGAIQDAVETGDYGQLNHIVNDTVGSAMEEVRRQVNQVHDRLYRTGWDESEVDQEGNWRKAQNPQWERENGSGMDAVKSANAAQENETCDAAGSYNRNDTDYNHRYRSQKTGYQKSYQKVHYRTNTTYSSQKNGQYRTQNRSSTVSGTGYSVPKTAAKQNLPSRYFRKNGNVAGILYTVFGALGTGIFGFWTLVVLLFMVLTDSFGVTDVTSGLVLGVLTASCAAVLGKGCGIRARLRRAERYMQLLRDKMFMEIDDLAARAGLSIKKVKKDLRIMLQNGTFPEGHMDNQETVLVLKDELWDQYLTAQKGWEEKKRQEQEKVAAETGAEAVRADSTAEQQIEKEGRSYMEKLRKLNDEIPGEVISNKLYKLDDLLLRIFSVLREHPEKSQQMRKFMDYYLPTTVKLVEAYADFDRAGVQSDNILTAKTEIEKTMDTINQAFEKLLGDMYQDAAFEAAADARVLKTILAQDGYTKSEFTVKEETKGDD